MSVRFKIVKAQIKRFFTRNRFIESYTMKKKLLAAFLVAVNAFVGWNLSLSIPEVDISIKWEDSMSFEQTAHALEIAPEKEAPKEEVVKSTEKTIEDLADYIWMKESTRGKNNYSKCEAVGKTNGIGYSIPGDGSYVCFESHDEEMDVLKGWLTYRKALGWSELKMLCTYSGQNYPECKM